MPRQPVSQRWGAVVGVDARASLVGQRTDHDEQSERDHNRAGIPVRAEREYPRDERSVRSTRSCWRSLRV